MNKPSQTQVPTTASLLEISGTRLALGFLLAICVLCVLVLINAVGLGTYSFWDDEGYFILILRHFLKSGGLYVRTFSQYGPFYTLAESSLHRLFHLSVDLDGSRILTVSYILASALLLSVFVGRLTRKLALSLSCFVLSVVITAPILGEPGHPQGLIAVLVSVGLCLSLLVDQGSRHENLSLVLLGAINGALALTKINVGLFFGFALALAFALALVKTRFRSVLLGLIVIGSFCMPPALMSAWLRGWAGSFCVYMLVSFVALYVGAFQAGLFRSGTGNAIRFRQIVFPILGFVAAAASIVAWAVLNGSTPVSLVSGIITRPSQHPKLFYASYVIPPWVLMVLLLPVIGFAVIPLVRRQLPNFRAWLALSKAVIALIFAGCFLWHPDWAMFYSLPVLPLLLLPSGRAPNDAHGVFPRLFLVSLIEFEMLQAYPVLDTHHNALIFSGAWICLLFYDGWSALATLCSEVKFKSSLARSRAIFAWLCVALAVPVLSWCAGGIRSDTPIGLKKFLRRAVTGQSLPLNPKLDLPGARLIRVPATNAAIYRRLANEVHANCDMLFTMPGMGSLNVWSETPPPNGFNLTCWMGEFTGQEQTAIRNRMEHAGRPCVVYKPDLMKFWIRPGLHLDTNAPMVSYVLQETKTVLAIGDYEIRVPYTRLATERIPVDRTSPHPFINMAQ